MTARVQGKDSQFDVRAEETLSRFVSHTKKLLVDQARKIADGRPVEPDDLEEAYAAITGRQVDKSIVDSQALITWALRENRTFRVVSYTMALSLVLLGIFVVVAGIFSGVEATYRVSSIVGGILFELLALIPFKIAANSHKHTLAIRMLAALLDRVDDPRKLAAVLHDTLFAVVVGKTPVGPKTK
jgi:hypothetical protein